MTRRTGCQSPNPRRVFVLGATGTIGRATVRALHRRGHHVLCFVRAPAGVGSILARTDISEALKGTTVRFGNVTDAASIAREGFCGERFDVLVSCLASRTGAPADAWAIDYQAHANALAAATEASVSQMVLLSAICVQKPVLAFQHAKLAFEKMLTDSGLTYSIVRPTAYFKSLSGQVDRLKQGKSFIVFGDGALTACKPISNDDVALFIAECLDDPNRQNRILPIGGPGKAITPKQQGEQLFALLGRPPRFTHLPVKLLDMTVSALDAFGYVFSWSVEKAELARIGRYYATESMLVLDPSTGCYDEEATPSFGSETLFDFYARLIKGEATAERGDHAVF
jgi:divinyl chlorophyllide a 8-vinyl-reductase